MNRRAFMQGVMAALAASSAPIALGAGAAKQTSLVKGLIEPSITDMGDGWVRIAGGIRNRASDPAYAAYAVDGVQPILAVNFDIGEEGIKALSSEDTLHFSFYAKSKNGGTFKFSEDGNSVVVEGGETPETKHLQLELGQQVSDYIATNAHNLLPWSEGKP